jgi:hypothetical protein
MRSPRWLAAAAAVTVLVTSIGVALAGEPEPEHEPWEVEAEGADKVAEVLPLSVAGRAAAEELGQAVKGGPAQDGGSPQGAPAPSKHLSFFPDHELPCSTEKDGALFGCGQALEPEVKSGPDGTIFATAQDGTPAGVMAWNCGQTTFDCQQLGKPDSLTGPDGETGLTGGGGDNELAIGTAAADGTYRVYVSSLNSLVTNAVAVSTDHGATWKNNVAASSFVGVDRQWLAAYGEKTAYLAYHEIYSDSILMTRTDDGGDTWVPPMEMITPENLPEAMYVQGSENIPGEARENLPEGMQDVSRDNFESNLVAMPDGGVALAFVTGAHHLFAAVTDQSGANPVNVKIADVPGPRGGTLFPSIAVDRAGNLYVVTSNLDGVFLSASKDRGQTWSPLVQVSGAETNSAVFPYVVAGDAGRVGVTWLASAVDDPNDETATWTTQYAFTDKALGKAPKFTVVQASDHIVHAGPVCLEGLNCDVKDGFGLSGNSRALAEVVQAGITKDGRVMIAYPDTSDGAHTSAWSWLVEQSSGPGLYKTKTTPPPPPPPPAASGGKVTGVSATSSQKLYFVNGGAGLGEAPAPVGQPGYAFDGTTIAGDLSDTPGTVGHVGVVGYAANSTPGAGQPVVFTAPEVTADTTLAGNLTFDLYVQNELADVGATELDFTLVDVAPDGTERPITGLGAQNGNAVVGGATPTLVTVTVPLFDDDPTAGWVLLAGHHLRLEMAFPFVVSSTTRFYYGDGVYPGALTLGLG